MYFFLKVLKYFFIAVIFSALLFTAFLYRPIIISPKSTSLDFSASPKNLENHVNKLVNGFSSRSYESPEELYKAGKYIEQEFKKYSSRTELQEFKIQGKTYLNVFSHFGPDAGERIIVGAHYDSFEDLPGADDNASGVAGVIEIARILAASDSQKINTPITLAAYTLEEPPFFRTENMGSSVHARKLKDEGAKVKLMLSLEMIGYFSNEKNSQKYPISILKYLYPSEANFIAVVSNLSFSAATKEIKKAFLSATSVDAYSINAPPFLTGIDFSDHLSFWNQGYEAVMITDTSFMRNERYHTPGDTPDTLDYAKMAEVVNGVVFYLLKQN